MSPALLLAALLASPGPARAARPTEDVSPRREAETAWEGLGDASMDTAAGAPQAAFSMNGASFRWSEERRKDGRGWKWGLEAERIGLSSGRPALLPATLQGVSASLSLERRLSSDWNVEVQGSLGVYGDEEGLRGEGFNGGSRISLRRSYGEGGFWAFGFRASPRTAVPFMPLIALRHPLSERWSVLLMGPSLRLACEAGPRARFWGGAGLRGGAYRLGKDAGTRRGRPDLDGAWLSRMDIRAGLGTELEPARLLSVGLEAGLSLYREFRYREPGLRLIGRRRAPYGRLSVSARF